MKKLKSFLLIASLLCTMTTFSQVNEENANIWYFGEFCGLDFNSGNPVALTDGALTTREGCASVCSENGTLLFYTDGSLIWDANHNIMLNGSGLMGNSSATQSSIIIPCPENDSIFYVFTVDATENYLANGLRYSKVNINLNGGLGSVTSTKNVLLYTPVCEKVTAIVHSNAKDVWVISHEWDSDAFYVYLIDSDSLHTTPVITNIGASYSSPYSSSVGYMKASVTGNKIAIASYSQGVVELFDFNKSDGTISNCISESPPHFNAYGVEFSPNEEILYVSDVISPAIYQYDISGNDSLNNPVMIPQSFSYGGALQIGPNGKIYAADEFSLYLGVINYPDSTGIACNFETEAVYLDGRICRLGLPSLFYYKGFQFVGQKTIDRKNEKIKVFPNPSNGKISIETENILQVEIININGQLIKKIKCDNNYINVDLSKQTDGIYFVKIITDTETIMKKIVKH